MTEKVKRVYRKRSKPEELVEELPEEMEDSNLEPETFLGNVKKAGNANKWKRKNLQLSLKAFHEREDARRRRAPYELQPVEGDNPRRWLGTLTASEKHVAIANLLMAGHTPEEIKEGWGLVGKEIGDASRGMALHVRAGEIRNQVAVEVLKKKGPKLRKIGGLTLTMLEEWAQNFWEEKKHLDMNIGEACNLAKFTRDMLELSRLQAGKPTNRTEVVTRVEHQVEHVIEQMNPNSLDDPFARYGRKTREGQDEPEPG